MTVWKKAFAFLILLMSYSQLSEAAFLRDVPQILTQPDGTKVECLVTGDEFYHRFHDENDYTIIRNIQTGYWVYAEKINDKIQPTQYKAGETNPLATSLIPGVKISEDEYKNFRHKFLDPVNILLTPLTGTINNICIFIRFSDDEELTVPRSSFDSMFNSTAVNENSMVNYFDEATYDQLSINTSFYPICGPDVNLSFQDTLPRAYYQPFDSVSNPMGYDADNKAEREHALLRGAVMGTRTQIPENLIVDGDNDNYVDNVCFVIKGTGDSWDNLLWPHFWGLFTYEAYINGARVYYYNIQLEDWANVGVFCHEMFHTLGAPDLYHYVGNDISPVSDWDLMGTDLDPPQHMSAYMKYRYGTWIDDIPEISAPGSFTLNPLTSSTNNVFKIASPNSSTDYFVVEYRRRESSIFENSLFSSGLLIYKINTNADGMGNAYGPPDEVYLYRYAGTPENNGVPHNAAFTEDHFRTAINDYTNPYCFLSDGTEGGISLSFVGSAGETISFDLDQALSGEIYDGSGGPLTQTGSPYMVVSDVIVPYGQTLTIEPGAIVKFSKHGKIIANGILNADGSTNSIELVSFRAYSNVKIDLNSKIRLQNGGELKFP